MKYYHGSINNLEIGLNLNKNRNGYTEHFECLSIENAFELFKPKDKISRKKAIYMVSDIGDLDNVGAYDDFVYEVLPKSIEKSDLSWYSKVATEMGDFFDVSELTPKSIIFIKNYWNSIPSDCPTWEYRTESAKILKDIDNDIKTSLNKTKVKKKVN